MAACTEFEDILREIESLISVLKANASRSASSDRGATPGATLDEVATRAAALITQRIVPLSSRMLDVRPLAVLSGVVAEMFHEEEPTFHEFANGFGVSFRASHGPPRPDGHRFARRVIETFARATFPRNITLTRGDSVIVQTEPEPARPSHDRNASSTASASP